MLILIYILTRYAWQFKMFQTLPTFVSIFILIILVAMYWNITVLSICISLVIKWGWKPLNFVHLHVFFFKVLFQAFLHFSAEFSVFFPWIWFVGIVYKFLDNSPLYIHIYIQKRRAFKRRCSGKIYSSFLMFTGAVNLNQSKISANHMWWSIEKIAYHDHIGFVLEMQVWYST